MVRTSSDPIVDDVRSGAGKGVLCPAMVAWGRPWSFVVDLSPVPEVGTVSSRIRKDSVVDVG